VKFWDPKKVHFYLYLKHGFKKLAWLCLYESKNVATFIIDNKSRCVLTELTLEYIYISMWKHTVRIALRLQRDTHSICVPRRSGERAWYRHVSHRLNKHKRSRKQEEVWSRRIHIRGLREIAYSRGSTSTAHHEGPP